MIPDPDVLAREEEHARLLQIALQGRLIFPEILCIFYCNVGTGKLVRQPRLVVTAEIMIMTVVVVVGEQLHPDTLLLAAVSRPASNIFTGQQPQM